MVSSSHPRLSMSIRIRVSISPLVTYPPCPDPCCLLHSLHQPGWRVSWRAWQQWAGVRAPHRSRANIHCNKKYSLMACTHHHSHRHWIHSARRGLELISPTTRPPAARQSLRGWSPVARGRRVRRGEFDWFASTSGGENCELLLPANVYFARFSWLCPHSSAEICHSEGGGRGAGDIMEEFYWNWTIPNMSPLSCQEEDWVFNHFGIHLILSWVLLIK